jgi:hypothetical protein
LSRLGTTRCAAAASSSSSSSTEGWNRSGSVSELSIRSYRLLSRRLAGSAPLCHNGGFVSRQQLPSPERAVKSKSTIRTRTARTSPPWPFPSRRTGKLCAGAVLYSDPWTIGTHIRSRFGPAWTPLRPPLEPRGVLRTPRRTALSTE